MQHFGTFSAAAIVAAVLGAMPAAATDWKAAMRGVDGVIVYCQSTTRQNYAGVICEGLGKAIEAAFDGSGLTVTRTGLANTGPGEADASGAIAALRTVDGVSHALLVRILIKGTDDGNPAIFVGTTARLAFNAAPDAGAERPGLAGDLVLAEDDVVANGPRNRLPKVLIGHMGKKAEAMVEAIRTGM